MLGDTIKQNFWKRWDDANELDKIKIVQELELHNSIQYNHITATLINSFFVDLQDYLKQKHNKRRN